MRKYLLTVLRGSIALLIAFCLVFPQQGKAQTTVVINTGTAGTPSYQPGPVYRSSSGSAYDVSRYAYLYTEAELQAAGILPGATISQVGWTKNNNATTNGGAAFRIYMKSSATANFSSATVTWASLTGGATMVYENLSQAIPATVAPDYIPFLLTTPFVYAGGSLEILTEWDISAVSGSPSTGAFNWLWSTVPNRIYGRSETSLSNVNAGNLSSTDNGNGNIEDRRPFIQIIYTAGVACSGTPTGGTTASSEISLCSSTLPFSLSVSGATNGIGLTYQWQSSANNTTYNDIPSATGPGYVSTGIAASTWFRRKISCGALSSYSTPIQIIVSAPSYGALPFTESFEADWIDACHTKDIPNNFWRNDPATGNNSWRRNDNGTTANWSSTFGSYTPASTEGTYSARFHSYNATDGSIGTFDLYLNCNTPNATKQLIFDFINNDGDDSLSIYVSTNGGASFTRVDSVQRSPDWRSKTVYFNSSAANTILRFVAVSDYGGSDIGLDNVQVKDFPMCSGTPVPGTASSTVTTLCNPITPFTLRVDGATVAGGLSWQWQSSPNNTTYTNISGATDSVLNMTGLPVTTWFRRIITCAGSSSTSAPIQVTVLPVVYTTLPFTESFENAWINACHTNDIPNNSWRNAPPEGNNSWRRNDDGASGNWTGLSSGTYSPDASAGTYSARFHSYDARPGTKGKLDVYLNCTGANLDKELTFDFINTSGSDSLVVYLSTNGGVTFTRLDSAQRGPVWTKKTMYFKSNSATTVIRFEATSDYGVTDIGLDNIKIINFSPCSGTPIAGTAISSLMNVCSTTTGFRLSVGGSTVAGGLTYQWERSTDGITYTAINGATDSTYNVAGITDTTWYRRKIICSGNSSISTPVRVTTTLPEYTTLPYTESFEPDWIDACDTRNVPNKYWSSNPSTGNASWRRYDDGVSADWTSPSSAGYTPNGSHGNWSARFHTYYAWRDSTGILDLYVKCNTPAPTKRLQFDYINEDGDDSLAIYVSTNAGATFTHIGTVLIDDVWNTYTMYFNSSSATTIIRFAATSDYGFTDIGLDNLTVADFPNCSGTPVGGKLSATQTSVCDDTTPFTINVTGGTIAASLTYQWQQSTNKTTWTDISGATGEKYSSTGIADSTYFRRKITCAGSSSYSDTLLVAVAEPQYATLPYSESFENSWIGVCNLRDVPNQYWRNRPYTGNSSWRRQDDGVAASWLNPTNGLYSPEAAAGTYSARFHSYNATNSNRGNFDFYFKANTGVAAKRLTFSYINTTGNDSLIVSLSTDGGTTFTRLDSVKTRAAWSTKTIFFNTTSATCVLRFQAAGDNGGSDIGLDDVFIIDWVDCTGTPNTGAAQSSTTTVCTEPFTLSATGITAGNGITYQWQKSTDNVTYSDISGATNLTLTIAQLGTTWYRLVTKCTLSGQSANSTPVQVVSPPLAAGNYIIDNSKTTGGNIFNNFNDAYNFIKCGISASVTFDVKTGNGPYNEQLIMTHVPGTSPTSTVTFKGNGVAMIKFASTNANERAVIKLKGTRFIIFDSLVINASEGTYGYGVQLMNNADSNRIKNCTIYSDSTTNATNFAGIVVNGTDAGPVATGNVLCDANIISGNTIQGGHYGITLMATFNGGANGNNQIIRNTLTNFYQYGIYVGGSYKTQIEYNKLSRPTRATVGDFYGIYFTAENNIGATINANRIYNPFGGAPASTGAFYGINFSSSDATPGDENIIKNNAIYKVNGEGLAYAISNTSSDYAWYFHNTISLDEATSNSTAATRGFSQTTTAGGLFFLNNLISITRGGTGAKHAMYLGANLVAASNNNDFYVNAAGGTNSVGFYQSDRPLLGDWRAATGQDATSLSVIPAFVNPTAGNFTPGNAGIDNKGIAAGIDKDINDVARDPNTPDIGAFEFTPPPCSVPPVNGKVRITPDNVCQNKPVVLSMNIGPYGSAQTFQWQISANQNGPFTNLGAPMLTPDTTIVSSITQHYRVAITCGTTTVYSDTVKHTVNPALPSGTYTINKGTGTTYQPGVPGGNFKSFADAKAAMGCGIIGGPVVFNVVTGSGPYIEQVKLDSIPGVTAVNNITFNGNGNTITDTSSTANDRAVIKLTGTDHVIFDSLIIDASSRTYHTGIELISNADSNTFRRCTILSSLIANSTDFNGIVINNSSPGPIATGATRCDGNTFDKNTITGGYYGITVVGGASPNYIFYNKFTNNTIREFYYAGMYLAGTSNTIVAGNTFSRPARTNSSSNVYGIYLTAQPSIKLHITKNRFTNMFGGQATSTAAFYGINHNAVDAASGAEDTLSNNLFYNIGGNGAQYALYNSGSDNVVYLHNTISLDDATASTAATVGFYQTTSASNVQFRNNMVTIGRAGTGNKHAIYLGTTFSEVNSNTNNLYVKGQNAWVGYYTANRVTLADWITASELDSNSVSENPLYEDPANGEFTPQLASIDNKAKPLGIPTDIKNAVRNATTPDIGAFEFSPKPCQNPPLAGTGSVTPSSGVCLEAPLKLTITGHSPLGNITFQWQTSMDGSTNWSNISPVQYFPEFNTVATISTWYRAAVTCDGTTVYTTPVQLTLNNILLAGTYTIDGGSATGGTNFKTFTDAVNAMLCGIEGKVVFKVKPGTYNEQIRIPYIPGTSNTATVTFQSDNGVASSAILSYSALSTSNYTLKLDSTKNFIFNNFTIVASNAAAGRAIELTNNASNDSIVNCVITAPITTTNNTDAAGIYANSFKGKNIVIKGNTISTGTHGIYFAGTSNTVLGFAGHVIDGNTVHTPAGHGIAVQYMDSIQITKNIVNLKNDPAANTAGIFANYVDSASRIIGNTVNIENVTSTAVYGIQIQNTRAIYGDSAIVAANKVIAGAGNTGNIYGLTLSNSMNVSVVNNVIAINTAGATAYGLYNLGNVENINYYNNSSNMEANAASGYPGYFTQNAAGGFNVRNNIFSNKGGGKALFVNNPARFSADYNLLYSTGAKLVQVSTGTQTEFNDIKEWKQIWNWDRSSISYAPAFVNNTDLRPDLNNPDVWAMHGRGLQIKGNNYDFDNNNRPEELTKGVPDLGAYEFYPVAQPTVLTAIPATPAPNTTQTFYYGSDTVMRISWAASAPASIAVRRFSGEVPDGLVSGTDSMFFYTKVEIPGGSNYNYAAKLYYVDSWQGSIPKQTQLGLGRTTPSNAWVVGQNSKVDVGKKEISQESIIYLDRFTGLVNPFAQEESEDSSSNRGKDFWVGYQRTNGFDGGNGGLQQMRLYLGTRDIPATVTVTIEGTAGTPWVRTYNVPANSAVISDEIPKNGPDDARLVQEGFWEKKGIHITSDVPVVAYAHIFENTNSGATMLMPTAVWGYEYYVLTSRQYYTSGSYSAFHVVAQHDSTWIEINPAAPTRGGWIPNGGTRPNGSYLVKLNKGDAYQVLGQIESGSTGYDLSGSYVKSVGNAQGGCYPIAVFSGSTRTGIGCGTSQGSSGDLIIQQIFPYQAWGNKYATAPGSNETGPTASSNMTNIYRIMVKDPATVVKVNGTQITGLVNNRYYHYESQTADYIEANKPILVAQYMSSGYDCDGTDGDGDPEMFYLSPLQQAVKNSQFYRNERDQIDETFITLVIPTEGLATLKIDGVNYQAYGAAERYVYDHPNLSGYSIVTKRWEGGPGSSGSSTVESEFPFTGIAYGLGGAESYGYNLGTLVKNLNNLSGVNTSFNTGANPTGYTCKGAPFKVTVLLPIVPESITWQFSKVKKLTPNVDSVQNNPKPIDTVVVNGVEYYVFTVESEYTFDTAGNINIPVQYTSPTIERCDQTETGAIVVQILPSPVTDFEIKYPGGGIKGCEGVTVNFVGDLITQNGIAINKWDWTFHNNSKPTGQNQSFTYPVAGTYPVKLSGITADGCLSDTTKDIVIEAKPVVDVIADNLPGCPNLPVTFTVSNPVTGATYRWYDAATGGTVLGTGTTFSPTNPTPPVSYYVEGESDAGCISVERQKVTVFLPDQVKPVVRVDSTGVREIKFAWDAVPDATSYEVSTNGGTTWVTPTSGPNGLTHLVTGLTPLQEVGLIVKAKAICGEILSDELKARAKGDQIFIPNAFTPNGDGKNDVLLVYGWTIKEMKFMVFNQWGQKIFESGSQTTGWDGTYKGKAQPSGVYMYVCRIIQHDGSEVIRKGSINLIR